MISGSDGSSHAAGWVQRLLTYTLPASDSLARGMGAEGGRAKTMEELDRQFAASLRPGGPVSDRPRAVAAPSPSRLSLRKCASRRSLGESGGAPVSRVRRPAPLNADGLSNSPV
jgi:hypothetical protein